ncbi:hypothetical protein ACRRTK_008449 [Alexandromys fortis]
MNSIGFKEQHKREDHYVQSPKSSQFVRTTNHKSAKQSFSELPPRWPKWSRRRSGPSASSPTNHTLDLDQLLDMSYEQLMQLYSAQQRQCLNRGLCWNQNSLLKCLGKAKKEAPPMEKPKVVKTHLRDMIILPEMVGSMVGMYNSKTFNQVEIKPEMIGH